MGNRKCKLYLLYTYKRKHCEHLAHVIKTETKTKSVYAVDP